jgi:lipopolysaccharide biosynthesis glycosyltransferase
MEDNDNFILEFIGALNLRKRVKRKIKWKLIIAISFMIIIFLIFLIIICLASENKKMKRILLREKDKQDKISFNIFNNDYMANVINFNKIQYPIKENEIHVSYSLDSKLIYPTYISMLSGLVNCDESNILVFHLLLSFNFNTSDIPIFETLKETYKVKIFYYIIPNIFSRSPRWTAGTDCVYYKILLPFLFPDLNRIIYLDGDTLIRKDISEMYNYPFNDNYILGFPFYTGYIMKRYGINKPKHYINGGCLLFNIKKIRKDKKDIDLLYATMRRIKNWGFLEQDAINYIFNPKIGFLPLKYGIYMIGSNKVFRALSKGYVYSKLNLDEGYEAIKDPSIVHFSCCWPKVWTNGTKNLFKDKDICLRYQKEFYYYANKTRFYEDIYNKLFFNTKKKKKKKNQIQKKTYR